MIYLAIFLVAIGLLMSLKPNFFWSISEQWKSADAIEPSSLYIWSIRLGGIMCACGGIAAAIVGLLER
jgi:hypothetical protein